LGGVGRVKSSRGFQFNDEAGVDDQVNPLARNRNATIMNGHGPLALKLQPARLQLEAERFLVDLLEEPGTERPMHFNRGAYRLSGGQFRVRWNRFEDTHAP
jgi:hypothetical protein